MTIHFSNPLPKVWVFTLFAFFSLPSLFSQNAELGVTLGGTAYRGDIEVRPNTALQQMRPMAGLFYRYHTSSRWAFRGQLSVAQLHADELHYPVPSIDNWREKRGISFTTTLVQLSILPELRIFKVRDVDFYAFAGVSGFYFKPTTDFNEPNIIIGDKNLDKNAVYSNFSWSVPAGIGMQWFMTERTALGFELSGHKSFTDFLDGLSLSASPKVEDYYFFANLTLSTFFGQKQRGGFGRGNKNVGCPTFD
jgi:hypothetical protein